MKNENIKQLLEVYFEGKSSSEEEVILRDYFSKENTDPELDCYKPIFQYFAEERRQVSAELLTKTGHKKFLIWFSSGIAACLILFLGLKTQGFFDTSSTRTSVAYIEGKKHTDISSVRTELFRVLDDLEEGNEQIFSSQIDLINDLFN